MGPEQVVLRRSKLAEGLILLVGAELRRWKLVVGRTGLGVVELHR